LRVSQSTAGTNVIRWHWWRRDGHPEFRQMMLEEGLLAGTVVALGF